MIRTSILFLFAVLLCGCSEDPGSTPEAGNSPPTSVAGNNPPVVNSGSNQNQPSGAGEVDEADSEVSEKPSGTGQGNNSTADRDSGDRDEANEEPVVSGPPPRESDSESSGSSENDSGEDVASGESGEKDSPLVAAFPKPGLDAGFSEGELIPEIIGEDTEGTAFRLSEYKDKVIMLDFWGDW
jgi:hypothetical protein